MLAVTWLGHSTIELKLATGETYLIDPWLDNPKAPVGYKPARLDAILLSHGHGDHTGSVLALWNEFKCPVVGIYDLTTYFETKGITGTIGMNKGGTVKLGPISVTLTFASHSSKVIDDGKFIPLGDPCGIIITLPGGRTLYFAGDTDVFGDMSILADLYAPEISFLPIGDHYTMGPKQAAYACRLLKSKTIIPIHYGTFPALTGTPQELSKLIEDLPETNVLTLTPGITVSL